MKGSLLFLCHRIPFPPNKGDKIRSFHVLKHLSQKYKVYLAAFVDNPEDWRYEAALNPYCEEIFLRGIKPGLRKVQSLRGLFCGEPLSVVYYRDRGMQAWVTSVLKKEDFDVVWVFSSTMAQYLPAPPNTAHQTVIDFVDVDSEKWYQYAGKHHWPFSFIYRREGRTLRSYEQRIAMISDKSLFVSPEEAKLFMELSPVAAHKVNSLENGVDVDYFDPTRAYENPYDAGDEVLVFTGAMDYWANEEAVSWFAHRVFPNIRKRVGNARFYIVGASPSVGVLALRSIPGVVVTGSVPDVRPFLAHARAAVAPLRVARGVQNKVLEAMAMAKPVLATHAAMTGIAIDLELSKLVTEDSPSTFAEMAVTLLKQNGHNHFGSAGRRFVVERYSWPTKLSRLETLLPGII